jgi:hypothetical protein
MLQCLKLCLCLPQFLVQLFIAVLQCIYLRHETEHQRIWRWAASTTARITRVWAVHTVCSRWPTNAWVTESTVDYIRWTRFPCRWQTCELLSGAGIHTRLQPWRRFSWIFMTMTTALWKRWGRCKLPMEAISLGHHSGASPPWRNWVRRHWYIRCIHGQWNRLQRVSYWYRVAAHGRFWSSGEKSSIKCGHGAV